jgi:SAM-dependent methyltransferase
MSERAEPTARLPACPPARLASDEPYQGYAAVYDALGQHQWGAALARFVLDVVLPERGIAPRNALDLACGTGAAALVLAGSGVRTVGLDRSAAMLREARRKSDLAGVSLSLLRGDLRAFSFRSRFDLALCCYDSLNYLTEPRELCAAMARVRDALTLTGLFVCDLTTRQAYTGELDGIAHSLDLRDLEYRWQTTWDEANTRANTRVTVRSRVYGRALHCSEHHIQRPYTPDEVYRALGSARLRLLATYGIADSGSPLPTPPAPDAPRVIYVATPAY